MLTISLAAILAATSSADSFPASNLQIARCTHAALVENHLSEAGAREIQVGTVIRIGIRRTVFRSGDSLWNLCERHLNRRIRYREQDRFRRQLFNIKRGDKPRFQTFLLFA